MNKNKILNKIKNDRKGISLVEMVVALVIITVVSLYALNIAVASSTVENDSVITIQASNYAENAIEAFRFAETPEEFLALLRITDEGFTNSANYYTVDKGSYRVTVEADFTQGSLKFTAVKKHGEEIYNVSYEK